MQTLDLDAAAGAVERCRTVTAMALATVREHSLPRKVGAMYLERALARDLSEIETALGLPAPQNDAVGRAAA